MFLRVSAVSGDFEIGIGDRPGRRMSGYLYMEE